MEQLILEVEVVVQEVSSAGASGGKGVVILSIPDANYSSTTTGSPTVTPNQVQEIQFYNLTEMGVTQHNGIIRKNRIK
jgi:hypothetical protein